MLPGFTAPKILWLKNHKPELFAQVKYIMLPHDFLNFILTDSYSMECGDASGTALFNSKERTWSKKMCNAIDKDLLSKLPSLVSNEKPIGYITDNASKEYGIPARIPVSTGGGDNMMGAIGTGTVEDGFLTMSMGTSGTLYGYSSKLISDLLNGISGFCSSTNGWLPLLCTMNCTVATEEMRKLFEVDIKTFDALAAKAQIGRASCRERVFRAV